MLTPHEIEEFRRRYIDRFNAPAGGSYVIVTLIGGPLSGLEARFTADDYSMQRPGCTVGWCYSAEHRGPIVSHYRVQADGSLRFDSYYEAGGKESGHGEE